MKIKDSENKSQVIGKTTYEESFSIGNVSRIIGILRNSMYSNPIQSIVREISCNARDAHREIGTPDRPIKITLPTQLSSIFSIKDYGLGISHQRMSDIFIKYGKSTKNGDNIQTGGFGLGAKTPFAYSDQFNITTITDEDNQRIKRVYTAYIDESESGKMRLSFEKNTDEETGTEISIHIKKEDKENFINETYKSLLFFKIKPEINNDLIKNKWNAHEPKNNTIFNSKDGSILNTNNHHIVLIDGIQYPLSFKDLNLTNTNDIQFIETLKSYSIIIYANNGELTLSANRENLQYDESTNKSIIKKLGNLYDSFIISVNKSIDECEYLDEVYCVFNYIFGDRYTISNIQKFPFEWKGKPINQIMEIDKSLITNIIDVNYQSRNQEIKFIKCKFDHKYDKKIKTNNIINRMYIINDTKNCSIPRSAIHEYIKQKRNNILKKINPIINEFITDDTLQIFKNNLYITPTHYIRKQYNVTYDKLPEQLKYVIKHTYGETIKYSIIQYNTDKYSSEDIVKILESESKPEHVKTINSSEIIKLTKRTCKNNPKPKKEKISNKEKNDLFANKFRNTRNNYPCAYLKKYPTDCIIAILNNGNPYNSSSLKTKYNNPLYYSYVKNQKIYCIKEEYYEKIKSNLKLETLDNWISNEVDKAGITKEQVTDYFDTKKVINTIETKIPIIFQIDINNILNKKSSIINLINKVEEFYANNNYLIIDFLSMAYNINHYYKKTITLNDDSIKKYEKQINDNYPLLSSLQIIDNDPQNTIDYINGIDLLKGNI